MAGHTITRAGGTTSACAENTTVWVTMSYDTGNYLRVRGEYSLGSIKPAATAELPPRARRIPLDADQ